MLTANKTVSRTVIGSLVVLLHAGALFANTAGPADGQRSVAVRYSDLDLTQPAGVSKLYHRIERAAESACAPRLLTGSNLPLPAYQRCYDLAVQHAVQSVDTPALSAYYLQHRPRTLGGSDIAKR